MSLLSDLDFQYNWRYEFKYRLTLQQYLQVINACQPFVQPDPFTKAVPAMKYLVRSLYFDSLDYQTYNEKNGGNQSRMKYRIRTYNTLLQSDSVIRVELKFREGVRTGKHGKIISAGAFTHFMKRYHWHCEPDPVLIEFERQLHARILRPKVLVEYFREGYISRRREDLRITFDHHVQSAQTKMLFPGQAFFRQHHPHQIILEIKCHDKQPDWLKKIVETHKLKIESNSKYCQGIEITQLDFVNHALRV
ncbi:MAG: polyphosphate polymerase domain-containing protein [Anaerolineaceae bacterium]|nr:polyphosphate polymerase domain-containing protein [Anaerolineaceae bacterium]